MSELVRRGDCIWKILDGEAVLLNPETGDYFGLNTVGTACWQAIDEPRSIDEIVDRLHEEYAVDRPVLRRDICELLQKMSEKGLVSIGS